jgi:hypothetical protein
MILGRYIWQSSVYAKTYIPFTWFNKFSPGINISDIKENPCSSGIEYFAFDIP